MREKYCWLVGGWKLVLEWCERKTLLGWRLLELPNRVFMAIALEPAWLPSDAPPACLACPPSQEPLALVSSIGGQTGSPARHGPV